MYRSRCTSVPDFALPRGGDRLRSSVRRSVNQNLASELGFHGDALPGAPSRLNHVVAATIAVITLSLCTGVALAVLTIRASMALPLPS